MIPPRPQRHAEQQAAQEHAPPQQQRRGKALQQPPGQQIIGYDRQGRDHPHGQRLTGDGQGAKIPMGRQKKYPGRSADHRQHLYPARPAPLQAADHQQQHCRCGVLQYRRRPGIGELDRRKISVLAHSHAEDRIKQQLQRVPPRPPRAQQLLRAADQMPAQQKRPGQRHPPRHQEIRSHMLRPEQILGARAAQPPKAAAQQRQRDAGHGLFAFHLSKSRLSDFL